MTFLKHNMLLKVVALVAAIMMAVVVHREADLARSFFVLPLAIEPPPGQRVVEPIRPTIRVDLEGPAEQIRQIATDDVQLKIDTSAVRPGRRVSVPLEVSLPDKYQEVLIDWRPRSVQVRFESDATKELTIQVKPLNPPDGWELREAPKSNPPRATISGPKEVVDRVASVVAPFSLPADERISTTTRVQALTADGSVIPEDQLRIEPPQVLVVGLQEGVVLQKRVPVQPIFRSTDGSRIIVEAVEPADVQVVGPKRLMSNVYVVETETTTLGGAAGRVTRTLPLAVPPGAQISPLSVKVTFKVQPQSGAAPQRPRGR